MKNAAKIAFLLAISLGLLWCSESFSPATIIEPQSTAWILWVGYAKDLIQPFAFYFFLCLGERWIALLRDWRCRVLVAFVVPALMELGQISYLRLAAIHTYFDVFDPWDIGVYATGVGLAAFLDIRVFPHILDFWTEKLPESE